MTNITTLASTYGLDRLLPTALGFENSFAALDNAAHLLTATQTAFPPVNVIKKDDYNFILELAVAGYKQDEIEITSERNSLKVTGKKAETDERNYLVKGLIQLWFVMLLLLMAFFPLNWKMSFLTNRSLVRLKSNNH
jgi:HSP20 family molecular chaperone IbpA